MSAHRARRDDPTSQADQTDADRIERPESSRPEMTPGDRRFCEMADEFRDWRGNITDCRSFPLSARDFSRFRHLCYNIFHDIRKRRPDLKAQALADLSCLDPSRLPPDGELLMLIEDASDLICETVHAITTGRVGEYIEAACPSLRKPESAGPARPRSGGSDRPAARPEAADDGSAPLTEGEPAAAGPAESPRGNRQATGPDAPGSEAPGSRAGRQARKVPRGELDERAVALLLKNPTLTHAQLAEALGCRAGTLRDGKKCPKLAAVFAKLRAQRDEFRGGSTWQDRRPDEDDA
jgi:hypothetical protein